MLVTVSALPVLRIKFAAIALAAATVLPGHAVARNHDMQRISIPTAPLALHDRATGPALRHPT